MFSIEEKSEGGFDKVVLRNNAGCFAEIVPSCGGALHAFGSVKDGATLNVIDHYASAKEFQEHVEDLGHKSCKLSPFVCRMKDGKYTFGEYDYKIENGYGPHALHGLIYRKAFSVVSKNAGGESASVQMQYHYDKEDPGFPFVYTMVISYKLLTDCRLRITTTVTNHSVGLMPLQDGWHPYFQLGGKIDDLELEFQSLKRIVFNENLIPTGEKVKDQSFGSIRKIGDIKLDNCYELDTQECQPLCVLRNPSKGVEVQIFPEKSYPYLQLYTPGHRRSIAIENISGPPNGFNFDWGHQILESGDVAKFETTFKIHFLN